MNPRYLICTRRNVSRLRDNRPYICPVCQRKRKKK